MNTATNMYTNMHMGTHTIKLMPIRILSPQLLRRRERLRYIAMNMGAA